MVDETVRREKALDFSECNSRPPHPVAEAAISSLDLLKRGAFS